MKYLVVAVLLAFMINCGAQSITATVTTSSVTCNGSCNGSATVAANGGNSPYSYFWSPSGGTTQIHNQLCGGNYSVMVTDSDGRTVTVSGTIQQPPPIQLNFTTTAQGCNTIGSATVSAYNTVAPY